MVTRIIIFVTVGISLLCFAGMMDINKMMFNAYAVHHQKQWYRMFSHGLVHSGWGHLLFNMLTLYFFGDVVEEGFTLTHGSTWGPILYAILYVSAIAVASIADLRKYRDDWGYNALGASGAVSAVLFAAIVFDPTMGIMIFMIPIPIPAYIFAPLYLLYCWYMNKRNMDNIGHSAHFWGAMYGLVFALLLA